MRKNRALFLLGLIGLTGIIGGMALCLGSVEITGSQLWHLAWYQQPSALASIVYEIRLPRVIAGWVTGALLALAGVLLQVLLRNPLADPYILGLSGGSSIGALLAMGFNLSSHWISASAWLGALITTGLVLGLAFQPGKIWSSTRLLLTGVVVASACGAGISLILVLNPTPSLHPMLFWLMGDLSLAAPVGWQLPLLGICLLLAWINARNLNVLSHGDIEAQRLGVYLPRLRLLIYLLASLLTALAVTLAGNIGFIGLIIPHLLRLVLGYDHTWLLPACVVAGGSFLVLADTMARTLLAPQQLPVGVITALLGAPVFLWLLQRERY